MGGEDASICVEVGDMFRSRLTGDMFCVMRVDNLIAIVRSVYRPDVITRIVAIKKLIAESIRYEF